MEICCATKNILFKKDNFSNEALKINILIDGEILLNVVFQVNTDDRQLINYCIIVKKLYENVEIDHFYSTITDIPLKQIILKEFSLIPMLHHKRINIVKIIFQGA